MQFIEYPDQKNYGELLARPYSADDKARTAAREIINQVIKDKDQALIELAARFDNSPDMKSIQVSEKEINAATEKVSVEMKEAINLAVNNIRKYHKAELAQSQPVETSEGVKCWSKKIAIEKVGLYIPGGNAPLFSSVLMLGIPAKIAGNKEIILCTPPDQGEIDPLILYTADLIGISKIYKAGGAQAIAAMAYGTETIPAVDKIFGPGNQYVTAAKQILSQNVVAIDMPAGPSEVLIIADETAEPQFIAADLLSQAEHGIDSQVICVTTSAKLGNQIEAAVNEQLKELPEQNRKNAKSSLNSSKIIIAGDLEKAVKISNYYAPEHLIIMTRQAEELAEKITNAGSVFIGKFSPESAGDYASGTNHVLPTGGWAASYSCLSVDDYMKKISFQKLSKEGLSKIGPALEKMAAAEKLEAHKNAVTVRLNKINEES
jgi:histidinol dehydrogenase